MIRHATVVAILAASVLIAGCSQSPPAPVDRGVCWHAIPLKGGKIQFNKLATNVPNLETCAATLEGMRQRFASFGGAEEIMGAYQGNYLFLKREGIFTADSLDKTPYLALVRTGDGRLAIPGAMPQD